MKYRIILSLFIIILILPSKLLALDGKHLGLKASGVMGGAICIFCHTPHSANTDIGLLWNKGTSPTTFTMYGETMAGTQTAAQPFGESLACLSCHDGVSAMNAVINAPGSGSQSNYYENSLDPGTYLLNSNRGPLKDIMEFGGGSGATKAVGMDGLDNDHPISIEYIAGRGGLKATSTPLSGWIGASTIKDLLRGPGKKYLQCSSCHDPHNDYNRLYKRATMVGSALCIGCHGK